MDVRGGRVRDLCKSTEILEREVTRPVGEHHTRTRPFANTLWVGGIHHENFGRNWVGKKLGIEKIKNF